MGNSKQIKRKKIGENLKIYREASGRAIEVVANSLGIDTELLKSVERGGAELNFVQYVGIAELYNIGFSNIFEVENDRYFYTPKIPAQIIEFIVKKANEYCEQKHITKKQLFEKLGTNNVSFAHFKSGYCMPTPQRVENMIALFGLKAAVLKNVACDEKPKQTEAVDPAPVKTLAERQDEIDNIHNQILISEITKKKNEPNNMLDAMTLVTDALAYYKNREKHIDTLRKIVADAQQLIEELGGAV